jgi:alanyl-tRNA synthetase
MLGNFSLGDYYKEEAIEWGWEFVTQVLGLKSERLWVTVYQDDGEAEQIWREKIGVPSERIERLGEEDNFWAAGPTGPCGPCSEIIYDRGEQYGCQKPDCQVGCDCDRYFELWNLVFMEFERDEEGKLQPLPKKNIDTGMGLERVALVMQGVETVFDTDTFQLLREKLAELKTAATLDPTVEKILLDHARAVVLLITDGVLPSNEGRGYVLRRLIRRVARFGRQSSLKTPFLAEMVLPVVESLSKTYPELATHQKFAQGILRAEEERFYHTLDQGLNLLDQSLSELKSGETLGGETAFLLYDTYGFPLELTEEIAAEKGFQLDRAGFEALMQEQRERSRKEWESKGFSATFETYEELVRQGIETEFLGHDRLEVTAKILGLIINGKVREKATSGETVEVILDKTPFYAEMGGQVGDTGVLEGEGVRLRVDDTQSPLPAFFVHKGLLEKGELKVGDEVRAKVNGSRRQSIARNHTATHLLHWALRLVLGEHIKQAGSYVADWGFRFDYTHFSPLTPGEINKVEHLVNYKIMGDFPVKAFVTSLDYAREIGAIALFGEKYDEFVRVLEIGNFSRELCGGTHVGRSGEVGLFKIVAEASIGANLRRIEAVTGEKALELVESQQSELEKAAELLKAQPLEVEAKLKEVLNRLDQLEKKISLLRESQLAKMADEIMKGAQELNGLKVLARRVKLEEPAELRTLADLLRERVSQGVFLLGLVKGDRAHLVLAATAAVTSKGFHAGEIIKELAPLISGGGGGKADFAQAGGKRAEGIEEALKSGFERIKKVVMGS